MTHESVRECYGFRVACLVEDPAALAVLDEFFGPEPASRPDPVADAAPTVRLTFTVHDSTEVAVEPPHTVAVIGADPIVIDTGSSRAVIRPAAWTASVALARNDLADPVVWGRWILERLFLYLVCRSPRHYPLHAGAVVVDGRGVLVGADTGGGKSTFTWWATRCGAELVGEDIMVGHLDEGPARFWGYPRAVYLSPDLLARSPELAGATRAAVHDGAKFRVTIPSTVDHQLRSAVQPACLAFLARGQVGVRRLDADEAVERCRDDFSTAKTDPTVLAAVAADLRGRLADLTIFELTVSDDLDDLDASYQALRSVLKEL